MPNQKKPAAVRRHVLHGASHAFQIGSSEGRLHPQICVQSEILRVDLGGLGRPDQRAEQNVVDGFGLGRQELGDFSNMCSAHTTEHPEAIVPRVFGGKCIAVAGNEEVHV